ncbi:TrmH family RNA methyltransferase [Enterococcus caccae]|uniref:RNA methyltransferase n=1 Tax=Enterococcus caccae ATCC BAA-1240 TaxID=1158612 RepID=R3W6B3_9ENTE|nr:RNA methyltransferase [Enterococcus caccae]EOL43236.1 RNA methyltransferase [Enterococcus caccae ATCC BAA-1240]EOT68364.1 RNA methyltransferase [Enterococcus caccae ATCC BAA-1240]OJG26851.1 RNA methyltransferase [Enterococcus caccae]
MKEILSTKNTTIKEFKKLHKKKYREEKQQYIIEGFHLIEEAVRAGAKIEWILFNQRGQSEWSVWLDQQPDELLIYVSEEVLLSLSELPTPQGMVAIVNMPDDEKNIEFSGGWLLLDNVQDPGNVGTMIRTADAAGLAGVILGEGTSDIYSTKVLRAMQGSNYHLPVIRKPLADIIDSFKREQIPVFGTELNAEAVSYQKIGHNRDYALIMGNEGQGVAAEFLEKTDQNIYIPIKGTAESLNVAIAAGILMYHLEQ